MSLACFFVLWVKSHAKCKYFCICQKKVVSLRENRADREKQVVINAARVYHRATEITEEGRRIKRDVQ